MLNISLTFPTKSNAPDASYAYGSARNVTTPNDGTGTPLVASWVNDWFGFQQAVVLEASIVPSNISDTSTSSQVLSGLSFISGLVQDTVLLASSAPTAIEGTRVFVKEYASGKSGGAFWDYVDLGTVTPNGIDIIACLAPLAGLAMVLDVNADMDIRAFGADPAAGDNSAIMQRAFSHPDTVTLTGDPAEVFTYTADVLVTGKDLSLKDLSFSGISAGITLEGVLTDEGVLTVGGAKGTRDISTGSSAGFERGNVIIIHNQLDFSFSKHRPSYQDGEFNRVTDITGATLTLASAIKPVVSYPISSTVKVFKVEGVSIRIIGCKFTSDDGVTYPLTLKYATFSALQDCEVRGGSTGALSLNKCYNVLVSGGSYINTAADTGLQYGVSVANSELITVNSVSSYGTRHAVTTGGDAADGAVPCRNIRIHNSELSNARTIYAADLHGNTVDSGYHHNVISGSIGLAGENVTAQGNIFRVAEASIIPIQFHEIVGGRIDVLDNIVEVGTNVTSDTIVGHGSSAIAADIDRDYFINVDGLDVNLASNVTRILEVFHNADAAVRHRWAMNNLTIRGDDSALTAIISAAISGTGIRPDSVSLTGLHYEVEGLDHYMDITQGSFSGCTATMPSSTASTDLTIESGGWFSTLGGTAGTMVFNYPNYPADPQLTVTMGPWPKGNEPYFAAVSEISSTQGQGFLTRADSSLTAPVDRTLRLTMEVTMDKVVL